MQVEGLIGSFDCDITSLRSCLCEKRVDVGSERLQRMGRLLKVIGKKEIADAVVKGVVETAFALEGITFAQRAIF